MLCALWLAALTNPLTYRWIYVSANLFREEEVTRVEGLIRRASKAGYNGILFTDTKLESLGDVPDFYRRRVERIRAEAKTDNMEIVPAILPVGYANGMLAHDPNLVEAIPVKDDEVTVKNGEAKPESRSLYVNGGLEDAQGDTLRGMAYQDGPGRASFVDRTIKHSGASSLRIEDPATLTDTQGNCRVVQKIAVHPWHQYRLQFWVKTEKFDNADSFRGLVLANGKTLSFADANIAATQDWSERTVVFNSLGNQEVLVYIGVWGGGHGKLWLDDVSLADAGLLNVVRRTGCPFSVRSKEGTEFVEGRDFAKAEDPKFGNVPWPGEYDMTHEPPSLRLLPASRIREGQKLLVSFYAPEVVGSGQVTICLSESGTIQLEKAEIARVDELFQPRGFMLSQDEFRVGNWCKACQDRKLTPGQMVAEDIRRTISMVGDRRPGATTFVWSDMFDPHHNAVQDYYLVNGPLTGSWNGLSKDTVVLNWNQNKPETLQFFADRGNRQILAGYYDAPPGRIKEWLAQAASVKGVVGVMYTTWQNRYDDLEAFAKAAWGQ